VVVDQFRHAVVGRPKRAAHFGGVVAASCLEQPGGFGPRPVHARLRPLVVFIRRQREHAVNVVGQPLVAHAYCRHALECGGNFLEAFADGPQRIPRRRHARGQRRRVRHADAFALAQRHRQRVLADHADGCELHLHAAAPVVAVAQEQIFLGDVVADHLGDFGGLSHLSRWGGFALAGGTYVAQVMPDSLWY